MGPNSVFERNGHMNYLTSKDVKSKGLEKFREGCGKYDHVTFLQVSAVTHYMLSENRQVGYIGLVIIEGDKEVNKVFFQNEDTIQELKEEFDFDWNMSAEEKSKILHEYVVYP